MQILLATPKIVCLLQASLCFSTEGLSAGYLRGSRSYQFLQQKQSSMQRQLLAWSFSSIVAWWSSWAFHNIARLLFSKTMPHASFYQSALVRWIVPNISIHVCFVCVSSFAQVSWSCPRFRPKTKSPISSLKRFRHSLLQGFVHPFSQHCSVCVFWMIVVRLVVLEYESFACSSLSCCACIDSFIGFDFFQHSVFRTSCLLCIYYLFFCS